MEDIKNLFEPVLDADENIIKMYAPDKKRARFGAVLYALLISFLAIISGVPAIIGSNALAIIIFCAVLCLVFLLSLFVPLIFIALWCNKTMYAVTNKRIIIRTGIIGVDFKSLDFFMLGAIDVNVNLGDKLLHRNTGSISFGSMSSPLTTQSVARFVFAHVTNPYETNKEVKAIIDKYRNKNSSEVNEVKSNQTENVEQTKEN